MKMKIWPLVVLLLSTQSFAEPGFIPMKNGTIHVYTELGHSFPASMPSYTGSSGYADALNRAIAQSEYTKFKDNVVHYEAIVNDNMNRHRIALSGTLAALSDVGMDDYLKHVDHQYKMGAYQYQIFFGKCPAGFAQRDRAKVLLDSAKKQRDEIFDAVDKKKKERAASAAAAKAAIDAEETAKKKYYDDLDNQKKYVDEAKAYDEAGKKKHQEEMAAQKEKQEKEHKDTLAKMFAAHEKVLVKEGIAHQKAKDDAEKAYAKQKSNQEIEYENGIKQTSLENIKIYKDINSYQDQNAPLLLNHMSKQTYDDISQMAKSAHALSQSANGGDNKQVIKVITDYAHDTLTSIQEFNKGVVDGVYNGFYSTAEAIKYIYDNPHTIKNLANNIMNAAPSPTHFIHSVKDAFSHYLTIATYGSAYEKGVLMGELTSNMFIAMATSEFAPGLGTLAKMAGAPGLEFATPLFAEILEDTFDRYGYAGATKHGVASLDKATQGSIRGWDTQYAKITKVIDAAEANASPTHVHGEPPYWPDTKVIHFDTLREGHFVRVYDGVNSHEAGSWMMRKEAIRGLSPKDIQIKYSLPTEPVMVSDVHVPKDFPMSRGQVNDILKEVAGIDAHTPKGTMQYRAEKHLPKSAFKNARKISDL